MNKNFDEFDTFLNCATTEFFVIVLTDTWIGEDDGQRYALPGYDIFTNNI